ncbi:MAG: GspE/PulE family protein, partial [Calditrichia bacterium]
MMVENKHKFSDEWLVKALLDYQIIDKGFVDESRIRYSENEYFLDVLLENNHLSAEDIAAFVENVLQIPFIDLNGAEIDPLAVEVIPEKICREYQIFPFQQSEKQIEVAFANPFNLEAEKEIAYLTGKYVKSYFGLKDQIKAKTEEYYSPDSFIDNLVDRANIEKTVIISGGRKIEENTPVVKLVSLILGDAIDKDASDIHIEPKEKLVIIRYRIDGILRNVLEVPKSLQASLTSRIKILANMNIAETRKPQDGGAKVVQDGTDIDLRISILPTNFGEKVVIRILDKRKAKLSFEQLGIHGENLDLLEKCFAKTQGIILVTGPTGSGKTTTLYAALNRIRNNTNNIITIEDPIEYKIEGINQVQVNEKAGVTFSSALRSFLRQDPDVMLVGEIRDRETAEIAIQASLTGHLVLSTLHTNDALVAITRLIDMGIDPYKIASSLEAIIAQRLVRVLCPHCRSEIKPGKSE